MGGLAEVLEGFEAELELERELGVRIVEIDRSLLKSVVGDSCSVIREEPSAAKSPPPAAKSPPPATIRRRPAVGQQQSASHDFVFLHHRALSKGGIEMMAKIVTAMKKTPEEAPIVFTGDRPKAKVYVVLGGAAMKMWFPELRCAPGQWARGPAGEEVLVTYSPEYILRFGTVTPAVKKIKMDMWTSLKGVLKKI